MPITGIDLERQEEVEEVIFLAEKPKELPGRRRRLSSCTLDDDQNVGVFGFLRQEELPLERIRIRNTTVKASSFIQVRRFCSGKYHVDYVLVKAVIRCQLTNTIKIRGTPFIRARSACAKLPKKKNELSMLIYLDEGKSEEYVDIAPADIIQLCYLIVTNAVYPKFNGRIFNPHYPREGDHPHKKQTEEALIHIHSTEAQTQFKVFDEVLRNRWRGNTTRGGSWLPSAPNDSIDLESNATDTKVRSRGQKYTMFDSCSGAGGVSRGALMAGFKVQYAIDKAPEVWNTYQTNFPNTELFRMPLDQLLLDPQIGHMRVDVLHFSPPCQFFSPAHTHASVHDDENIFALYGCNQLLRKLRPRIITVEQTFGLAHDRHEEHFHAFIQDFTQHNYSIRWKIVKLCTWGAAQDRKRLILIAAAPGERLPPFPAPTHGNGDGLMPYNTIGKVLRGIRPGDDLHDLDNVHYYNPERPTYDPERLAGTITTGEGDLYYPDGSRKLTLRELASMQGFPKSHRFLGNMTSIKRQIGNAFPPTAVRVLYKHIETWLLKEDGMISDDSLDSIVIEDDTEASTRAGEPADYQGRPFEMMEVDMVQRSSQGLWQAEDMVIDLT
ncbi:S-adenosyl-L-methionine-dependent methyltransferase [Fusarium flagelliforme]|uniref:S-adenosyl-L-methionine-dependent methyltransferase n=1 Tax=Fusarium flagelliforme TaxID=2675880 RepID=UPI001E8D4ECB|nr:S-adenosyl-L-methionine-dependent methyltransferase [Fusarium flagelliforme]KAH7185586.1 S-adenosyl-L-methionine-dependent methyltransferase [Fusarium flagelliforme]